MSRRLSVDDWLNVEHSDIPDGSWLTMMSRVASFHHKHRFSSEENHGHDMGFRIALTVEELADLLILILGHSLAMEVDLEGEFHKKMDRVMTRKARTGKLGIRVTEYSDD